MECLGRYTFLVMTSVMLSGGMKMRDEHGMLKEVYISCHDFCHGRVAACRGQLPPGRFLTAAYIVCGDSALGPIGYLPCAVGAGRECEL